MDELLRVLQLAPLLPPELRAQLVQLELHDLGDMLVLEGEEGDDLSCKWCIYGVYRVYLGYLEVY